jgi:glycosyltransferase XagB
VLPAALGAERRGLQDLRWLVPLMPLYYVLAGVAALRAFRELATDPFRWDKTEHGLARTSRTGAAPSLPKDAPAYERASQSFAASSGARFTLKLPTNRFFPSIR